MNLPFTPVLSPLKHQAEFLETNARRSAYALFHEQGTGKTKSLIDNIALLAMEDSLNGAFVLAPNGVHRNWHVEELPKHWPSDAPPMVSFSWDSTKAETKTHAAAFKAFLTHRWPSSVPGVRILCMSYDALMTEAGKKASWDFLRSHKAMYVCDESQRIKTPDAARTKRVIASSAYAPYRRIASGTPMDTPFDIYSQVRFIDPLFWQRELGLAGFTAFKAYFAEWIQITTNAGRSFPQMTAYRNQDVLREKVASISSRVLKEDVLDLPPKVMKRMFHELTKEQHLAYNQLREEAMTLLDSDEIVTVDLALVLQMRLAQITSGFIKPNDADQPYLFPRNPRAALLKEVLEDQTRPAIIWGRFVHDCEIAAEASRKAGRRPVVYDGTRPELAIDAFKSGEADDIIANLSSSMIEGWTLTRAKTTIYVSNSPKLIARQQSEDRNHRIGQDDTVLYIDMLAEGTADVKTLDRLIMKRELTGSVLGDGLAADARASLRELLE